jgi:hypothetical protein
MTNIDLDIDMVDNLTYILFKFDLLNSPYCSLEIIEDFIRDFK